MLGLGGLPRTAISQTLMLWVGWSLRLFRGPILVPRSRLIAPILDSEDELEHTMELNSPSQPLALYSLYKMASDVCSSCRLYFSWGMAGGTPQGGYKANIPKDWVPFSGPIKWPKISKLEFLAV